MKKIALLVVIAVAMVASPLFAGGGGDNGKKGGTVRVLGVWGGQELDVFKESIKSFEEKTGIKIEFESTRDIDAILTTRVAGGNPPDVAILPGPGKMIELAKTGKLVEVGKLMDPKEFDKNFNAGWKDLGTVDGKLYGLFMKAAIKGLVWYNPKTLKTLGIEAPKTWDEMLATGKKIQAAGLSPWSIGIESGAASGWTGTDWLENIFLRVNGPQKYKDWYEGKLSWTSPEVKKVWQTWGQVVADAGMAYGGKQYINSTNFGNAPQPLFQNPPKAVFHQQASFIQGFIMDQFAGLKPTVDFDFAGFPAIDAKYSKAVEGAADVVVALRDKPEVRQFLAYLVSAESQAFWATGTGGLATNKNVSLVFYKDDLTKRAADILNKSEIVVFDASDMMKSEMNAAFWKGVVDYVNNPADLDRILADLEKVRLSVYK